ncbi:MAG: NUDIX domain-containing protein [Chlamydiales bacterium]|nr:NUDIX domain-containing protein [Chlamydiales bacterium]
MKEDCFHLGIKGLMFNDNGKVLLLKRAKEGYWDLPGGRLQRKESQKDALKREIEEEIGFCNIDSVAHFITLLTNIRIAMPNSDLGLILSIYSCSVPSSFTPLLSSEHVDFAWFTASEAANLLHNYPAEFAHKLTSLEIM